MSSLLITVRSHDGRYHGAGNWPPSPARLFQALVAGAGLSGPLVLKKFEGALRWIEEREPPIIASPVMVEGQSFKNFVPNNDLDAKGGDARLIGSVRTVKPIRTRLFDADIAFLYAWTFGEDEESERHAQVICTLTERLYQFGCPVDIAWAWGELLDNEEFDRRLSAYSGLIFRPSVCGSGRILACPQPGSLQSLKDRYEANSRRFLTTGSGKTARQIFSQAPKARFVQQAYDSPPTRRVYELRELSSNASFGVWPLGRASSLVVWLRNRAVDRLREALPDQSAEIERVLIGRKADGADSGPTSLRVKIVPLPSIGHHHVDHGIRRLLVEVPAGCPLRADDVHWAFSGLDLVNPETGEVLDLILIASEDETMLQRYGLADRAASRVWRTVTPAVLPESAKRRRIDPTRMLIEAKDGAERSLEQARSAAAVAQALRHAEVLTQPETIRVQREPFDAKGERAEAFAPGTRFQKERLWHIEISFNASMPGPLVIGDGRFLGLGVMAPVQQTQGIHAFLIETGLAATLQLAEVTRALRRAVMARVQRVLGSRTSLPAFFTGHERDGSLAKTERHPHLTFVFDPESARLLIVAPHVTDRRVPTREEIRHLRDLDLALREFRELRAGSSGYLMLRASSINTNADPLLTASRIWESVTPYQVTRHTKQVGAAEALSGDLTAECRRRGLPDPQVIPRDPRGVPGVGLVGEAKLTFEVAVEGPIILGRSRHLGGGLFAGFTP
jgi:CRISPR-associated protein Csb2